LYFLTIIAMLNVNNTLLAGGFFSGGPGWDKQATKLDQCFKIYYVRRGEAIICSGDTEHSLKYGHWYFINGYHIASQCCPVSLIVEWVHFITDSVLLKQYLQQLPAVVELSKNQLVQLDGGRLFEQYFGLIPYNRHVRDNTYYAIYLQVQSIINTIIGILIQESGYDMIRQGKTESRLIPAIEYINQQYKTVITLKGLADMCYLSENYFHKLFKTTFKVTPYNYVLQLRMDEAVRLLGNTNMSIKEMAEGLGYKDVAYFTRTFSKYYGTSPAKFRSSFSIRIP